MTARTVVVRLTVPQARAACSALGYALAGEVGDVFLEPTNFGPARRAHAVLSRAVEEAGGWDEPARSPLELARAAAERAGIDPSIVKQREDGALVIDVPIGGGGQ